MARLVAAIILALGFAPCSVAHEALLACDSSSFPVNLTGTQINGLHRKTAANADACRQACCDEGSSCHVWQWAQGHTCWIGKYGPSGGAGDYVSFGRDIPKPTSSCTKPPRPPTSLTRPSSPQFGFDPVFPSTFGRPPLLSACPQRCQKGGPIKFKLISHLSIVTPAIPIWE